MPCWPTSTRRLAAGQPGPVSALFLDLDRLKAINDYLGHTAGDWFIRVFAKRLREGAEGPNLIARLGGDEFVVVPVAPMTADEAETLANRLQADTARAGVDRRRDAHPHGQHRCRTRRARP